MEVRIRPGRPYSPQPHGGEDGSRSMSEAQLWSRPSGHLDTTPLTEPIDDSALAAFVAESKQTDRPWRRMTTGLPQPTVGDVIGKLLPVVIPLIGLLAMAYVGGAS